LQDYGRNPDDFITEESDPHLVKDVEKEGRPKTPGEQKQCFAKFVNVSRSHQHC